MIRLLSRMGPALLLATGVIAAEVLGSAPAAGLWRLAAPALLVLTLVTADLLRTRLLGGPMRVSSPAKVNLPLSQNPSIAPLMRPQMFAASTANPRWLSSTITPQSSSHCTPPISK